MGAQGSAIVWMGSEAAVCLGAAFAVFRKDFITFPTAKVVKAFLLYLPLLGILLLIRHSGIGHFFVRFSVAAGVSLVYFIIVSIIILKDPVVLEGLHWLTGLKKDKEA